MMSRFIQEITGQLGTFWKNRAEEEIKTLSTQISTDAIVEQDGAIKWKSNGQYLPDDLCEKLEYINYSFSRKATSNKRDEQVREQIQKYIKHSKDKKLSNEEKFEIDSAYEPETHVVNVLTEQTVYTTREKQRVRIRK